MLKDVVTSWDVVGILLDISHLLQLYVMEKHSLLMRLRMKKEAAIPLENNQASLKFKVSSVNERCFETLPVNFVIS